MQIAEARIVLLDEEKKGRYDGIHSAIEIVWHNYGNGDFDGTEQRADWVLAVWLAEILSDGNADRRAESLANNEGLDTVTMLQAGRGGCSVCWESEQNPTATYKYCSGCAYVMHDECWTRWETRCLTNELPASCAHCRRKVAQ